jgi:hypothetical protein
VGKAKNCFQQRIYYRLIPSNNFNFDLFQINETTGEIFFKNKQKISSLNHF